MERIKNNCMKLKTISLFLCLIISTTIWAQVNNSEELSFSEFLGYVKKYHPLVKQANLEINKAQAALLAARGGFDPKIEVDFSKKEFKDKEYYSLLNSTFKIPTWYGVELKAGFDNNEGIYLNPQNSTPNSGLTSFGIDVALGQGLFINQRMADLRMAKVQLKLSEAEKLLQTTNTLYNASIAYFNWRKLYNEVKLYEDYLVFAKVRYKGVKKLIELGDKPAIDSIEAGIIVRNRELNIEDSKLKLVKARLELSNFLWIENVPVELNEKIIPENELEKSIQEEFKLTSFLDTTVELEQHPKIQALQNKIEILTIEKKLKANMLLPKVNAGYYYLSEPSYIDNYRFEDYKIGLNFSFPIFLRKERGALKMSKLKLQDSQLDLDLERVQLKNKINAQQAEIVSMVKQIMIINALVNDYTKMLESEERLFSLGESSIFLLNSRENNVVSSKLSEINLETRYLISNADLFKLIANPN